MSDGPGLTRARAGADRRGAVRNGAAKRRPRAVAYVTRVKGNRTLGASAARQPRHYRLLDKIMIPFGLRWPAAVIA